MNTELRPAAARPVPELGGFLTQALAIDRPESLARLPCVGKNDPGNDFSDNDRQECYEYVNSAIFSTWGAGRVRLSP